MNLKFFKRNKFPILVLIAVLALIYLFAPAKINFVTAPQLFTANENGSLYLPASSSGSTCSGNSCVPCDPDHASCDSCPGGCAPSCTDSWGGCGSCADSRYQLHTRTDCSTECVQTAQCQQSGPPTPPGNPAPIGFHDISDCTASYGWTCDASDYSVPLTVHFYTDGGVFVGLTTANIPAEPGVAASCGGFSAHRFQFTTPDLLKNGINRSIFAYALDYPSNNNNPLLSGSPKTINCPLPSPSNLSASCPIPGSTTNLSWSAVIGATYYALRADNTTANGWSGLCDGSQNSGDICQNVISNTFSFSSQPGASYNWWVHACNTGGCSSPTTGSSFTCQAPLPTASISADTNPVVYNTATTIRWSSTNATSCTVSPPGWTGTSGAQSTDPLTAATTYTVNCSGLGGNSAPASVTVNIQLPGSFSLVLGGSVACNSVPLSWTASSGAQAYRILKGSPRVDISPYQPYTALNFTDSSVSQNTSYVYQIEAYNSGGTNRSNALNVDTPFCPPTLNFSADRTSIFQGQSVTLTWDTTYVNPNSCTASSVPIQSSWSGTKAANGNQPIVPLPPPSVTYNLQCSGPGGTSPLRTVIINITALALPEFREIIPR